MNILVIASHPDDEVLGCGGTLARFAREGSSVHIAILGEGLTSRLSSREAADPGELKALRAQSQAAGALLGAAEVLHFGLPDNRFDTVPQLEVTKIIEGLVERLQPEIVFTQHGGDLNIDHVVTWRATLTATRPMAGHPVKRVFGYPVGSSTEWAFQKFSPSFRPTTFFDIEDTLPLKVRAMQAYEGESRPFPHPRSGEALEAAARHWGAAAGLRAAEPFELVREIIRAP